MSDPTILKEQIEGVEQELLDLGDFPIDSLMIRTETRTVFDVVRRIDAKHYVMDPDFQRDFIWDQARQSKLIESAILRIPLPVFYLAETREGQNVVVDGLQRLTTFHRFVKNEFALKGLNFARSLNGKKFQTLAPVLQNRIEDTQLTLYLIDGKVPETAKYEIFERVNGGVPLTRQQMRNCLFVGVATRWLKDMASNLSFLTATGAGLNSETMRDRECINRFAGFYLVGPEKYEGSMENFLNSTLRLMNSKVSEDELRNLSIAFEKSMDLNKSLFGEHAFRKSLANSSSGASRSVINVALFDVFSVALAKSDPAVIANRSKAIQQGCRELFSNLEFLESISRSTNSTRNVQLRFRAVGEMLERALS